MSEVTYAKHYYIADARLPDLDKCWSACNGVEGFGHAEEDKELNKARRKHGECLESLACSPRLILYRETKASPLMAKLWTVRTIISADDDVLLLMGSLAKACYENGLDYRNTSDLDVYLIDWGPGDPSFEISIEVVDSYADLRDSKATYGRFMKHFDKGAWK